MYSHCVLYAVASRMTQTQHTTFAEAITILPFGCDGLAASLILLLAAPSSSSHASSFTHTQSTSLNNQQSLDALLSSFDQPSSFAPTSTSPVQAGTHSSHAPEVEDEDDDLPSVHTKIIGVGKNNKGREVVTEVCFGNDV